MHFSAAQVYFYNKDEIYDSSGFLNWTLPGFFLGVTACVLDLIFINKFEVYSHAIYRRKYRRNFWP